MKESTRICRFAVIGTLNALIQAITIWVMMDELDINYMLSNVTAYILAQTHNFIWCKYWVFPTEKKNGDYMVIPKQSGQRQHNFHYLDLDKPYSSQESSNSIL